MRTFSISDIADDYNKLHCTCPSKHRAPVIGLTSNFRDGDCTLAEAYFDAVQKAGGVPMMLPRFNNHETLVQALEHVDGILLTDDKTTDEDNERQKLMLVRLAANRQIPMLGICQGLQAMKAALGGSNFRVCDRASDEVIEAMESTEYKSMLGVQWHPEGLITKGDECMMPLFRWLVQEAASFMEAKRLHSRILTLDSHCDTPMFFDQQIDFASRDPKILVDLHKMTEGRLDACIMVAYLEQQGCCAEDLKAATAKADRILDEIEAMVAKSPSMVEIARTPADLYRLKSAGKKAIMLGIENGYAIGNDISNVARYRERGVVYMTLCHNGNNQLCGSAKGNDEGLGVNDFGRQVIEEMNRVGMMVDISHAGVETFYDALEVSRKPIVASHSSARALCNHPRNLTDEQLKALAAKGGVAQVTLYHGFLRENGTATIVDAINHLNHMVKVMGIEHVGIGTDFDGDGGIVGCASASELINFTRRLLKEKYSEEDIRGIWGGNFLRVMEEVQRI